jgi:hypothetical protein
MLIRKLYLFAENDRILFKFFSKNWRNKTYLFEKQKILNWDSWILWSLNNDNLYWLYQLYKVSLQFKHFLLIIYIKDDWDL